MLFTHLSLIHSGVGKKCFMLLFFIWPLPVPLTFTCRCFCVRVILCVAGSVARSETAARAQALAAGSHLLCFIACYISHAFRSNTRLKTHQKISRDRLGGSNRGKIKTSSITVAVHPNSAVNSGRMAILTTDSSGISSHTSSRAQAHSA